MADRIAAEVRFSDRETWRIEWQALTEVGVTVVLSPEGEYAETFWVLRGRTPEEGFEVPVQFVAGSEAFNARLFDLPEFDPVGYVRARKSEARSQPGFFVCWRAPSNPPAHRAAAAETW